MSHRVGVLRGLDFIFLFVEGLFIFRELGSTGYYLRGGGGASS